METKIRLKEKNKSIPKTYEITIVTEGESLRLKLSPQCFKLTQWNLLLMIHMKCS